MSLPSRLPGDVEMSWGSAVSADQLLGKLAEPRLKEWASSADMENVL